MEEKKEIFGPSGLPPQPSTTGPQQFEPQQGYSAQQGYTSHGYPLTGGRIPGIPQQFGPVPVEVQNYDSPFNNQNIPQQMTHSQGQQMLPVDNSQETGQGQQSMSSPESKHSQHTEYSPQHGIRQMPNYQQPSGHGQQQGAPQRPNYQQQTGYGHQQGVPPRPSYQQHIGYGHQQGAPEGPNYQQQTGQSQLQGAPPKLSNQQQTGYGHQQGAPLRPSFQHQTDHSQQPGAPEGPVGQQQTRLIQQSETPQGPSYQQTSHSQQPRASQGPGYQHQTGYRPQQEAPQGPKYQQQTSQSQLQGAPPRPSYQQQTGYGHQQGAPHGPSFQHQTDHSQQPGAPQGPGGQQQTHLIQQPETPQGPTYQQTSHSQQPRASQGPGYQQQQTGYGHQAGAPQGPSYLPHGQQDKPQQNKPYVVESQQTQGDSWNPPTQTSFPHQQSNSRTDAGFQQSQPGSFVSHTGQFNMTNQSQQHGQSATASQPSGVGQPHSTRPQHNINYRFPQQPQPHFNAGRPPLYHQGTWQSHSISDDDPSFVSLPQQPKQWSEPGYQPQQAYPYPQYFGPGQMNIESQSQGGQYPMQPPYYHPGYSGPTTGQPGQPWEQSQNTKDTPEKTNKQDRKADKKPVVKPKPVKKVEPSTTDSDTDEEEEEEDTGNSTVKVTLNKDVSEEALLLYFENRKSGGGDIKEMQYYPKEKVAIIQFENQSDAEKVLKKSSHKVEGHKLTVTACKGRAFEEDAVLVEGLNEKTSKDCLQNYMESRSNIDVKEIFYGEEESAAIVLFTEKIDIDSIQKACKKKQLEKRSVKVSPVLSTSSVQVTGVGKNSTTETLRYYFENGKRSGGGDLERDIEEEDDVFIVCFQEAKVARSVLEHKHKLDGSVLKVSLYYPVLGLQHPEVVELPSPCSLEIEEPMMKFLLNSEKYKQIIEKDLAAVNAKPDWLDSHGAVLTVKCTLDLSDKPSASSIRSWPADVENVVAEFKCSVVVKTIGFEDSEIHSCVFNELKQIDLQNPEDVSLINNKDEISLCIIGKKEEVTSLKSRIDGITKNVKKVLKEEKEKVTDFLEVTMSRLTLLQDIGFEADIKSKFPNLSLSWKDDGIEMCGSLNDINAAKVFVLQTTSRVSEGSFDLSPSLKGLLSSSKVMKDFKQRLKELNITASIHCELEKNCCEMTGKSEEDSKKAIQAFKNYFKEDTVEVEKDFNEFCQSDDWQTAKAELDETFSCKFHLEADDEKIYVAAISDILYDVMNKVKKCVAQFVKKHSLEKAFIPVSEGQYECIEKLKCLEKKIEDSEIQSIKKHSKPGHTGYEIWGNRDAIRQLKPKIQEVADGIKEDKYSVKKAGCKSYFASQKGKDDIKGIENNTFCVIQVRDFRQNKSGSGHKRGSWNKSFSPETHATCEVDGVKFKVVQSDITQLDVDVLVSAANPSLKATGGIAKAIIKKGGKTIETECQKYISKNGKLEPGDAIRSTAGKLSCKCIVHAVTKTWEDGKSSEMEVLREAVMKILNLSDESFGKSVAFPALGSGIYKYPVDKATNMIVKTIKLWLSSDDNENSSIGEIYLCDVNHEAVEAFSRALLKHYGHSKTNLNPQQRHRRRSGSSNRHSFSESDSTDGDDDDGGDDSDDDYDEPDELVGATGGGRHEHFSRSKNKSGSAQGHGQRIEVKVIKEELSKMKVDVIVNSTNNDLDMDVGALSRSLLSAGGKSIQKDCKQKYPNGIKHGEIAVTKGGNLACQKIYHGIMMKWDGGKGAAMKSLQSFVMLCLEKADEFKMKSIAIPALGTGQLGYPADQVARLMFQCAATFTKKLPNSHLQKILFVVYPKDTATVKAFLSVESQVSSDDGLSAESESVKWGNVTITVDSGDITKETSDVVVNSISESMDFSKGATSKAILKAAGPSLQQECNSKGHFLRSKGLLYTDAGNMQCKKIFHIKAQKEAGDWGKAVYKCLEEAEEHSYDSVSFPALGTGAGGCTPDEVAGAMFKAISKFSNTGPSSIQEVRVIVFQTDMLPVFLSAMSHTSKGSGIFSAVKEFFGFKKGKPKTPVEGKQKEKEETVILLIRSNARRNIDKAKRQIEKLIEEIFSREIISAYKDIIKKIQTKQIEHLIQKAGATSVRIIVDTSRGEIIIEGPKDKVLETALSITHYLRDFEKEKEKWEKAADIAKYVEWYYDKDGTFTKFYLDVNLVIETAYKEKKSSVEVTDRHGTKYFVDLKNMEEYVTNTPGKKWKIQRKEQGGGGGTIKLPSNWDKMKADELLKNVCLQPGSSEYEKVKGEFHKSAGQNYAISKIERIQNRALYQQYAAKRSELQNKNKKEPQQWLWHGTDVATVDKICHNGFNRSYCGKHGVAIGNGVYFAVNASYSVGGYCAVDNQGNKHIFSAQVLTGDPCLGRGGMTVLPPKSGGILTYDSATNNLSSPSMYVIFHDSQAYPTYHITFQ